MADVYLARQLELDRLVALKELRLMDGADPAFAKRFLREAKMAGSLSHPNIVTVHDYIESEGTPYIAMEYMERGSLRPWIGRMSLAQVAGVLQGVLSALAYAGERGIVHRDIKPENVMIGADGRVKIADFGIAKARYAFQTAGSLTAEGTALGTPNYMAPEQASAEEVGPWTDLYAVGVMAFEIFVGRPPFADTPQPLVVLMRQVRDPIPRVTDLDPRIDPRIAAWISWLTNKDPSERPQNAAVAWDRFEEVIAAILGPRWQRGAPLLAGVDTLPPEAHAAPVATAGIAAVGVAAGMPTPATQPLDDGRLAATVPANPGLLGIDRTTGLSAPPPPAGTTTRKPNAKRALLISLVAAAVLVPVAFGALRSGGGTGEAAAPPPATSTPAPAQTTTSPAEPVANPGNTKADLSAQARDADRLARQYRAAAAKIEALRATGAQAAQNAQLADLTRQVADAYARAAAAARRGDENGYSSALGEALAAKAELDAAAKAPAPSAAAAPSAPSSACAGDSTSDDPSDDACGGGEP